MRRDTPAQKAAAIKNLRMRENRASKSAQSKRDPAIHQTLMEHGFQPPTAYMTAARTETGPDQFGNENYKASNGDVASVNHKRSSFTVHGAMSYNAAAMPISRPGFDTSKKSFSGLFKTPESEGHGAAELGAHLENFGHKKSGQDSALLGNHGHPAGGHAGRGR